MQVPGQSTASAGRRRGGAVDRVAEGAYPGSGSGGRGGGGGLRGTAAGQRAFWGPEGGGDGCARFRLASARGPGVSGRCVLGSVGRGALAGKPAPTAPRPQAPARAAVQPRRAPAPRPAVACSP